MPYWAVILLIVGLSIVAFAVFYWALHAAHRVIPAREAAQGNPEDISTPLSMRVVKEVDAISKHDEMTARELEEEGQRDGTYRASTYEIVRATGPRSPAEVVTDLPPAEIGAVLFYQGRFWRVDAIEPARSREADGRLIVTLTTDEPRVGGR
jgi:hypothetical protein